MSLVQRVTNILTQPKPEWDRIAAEPANAMGILTGYAAILAALPAVAGLLPSIVWGSPISGLVSAVLGYILGLAVLFVMSMVAGALAPSFGGVKSDVGGMKLVAYAATPTWVIGIVTGFLNIIPILGWLISFVLGLAAFAYAAYLLYLGSGPVMRVPQDKAPVYTIVLILIWIVLFVIVGAIVGTIAAIFAVGAAVTGAAAFR